MCGTTLWDPVSPLSTDTGAQRGVVSNQVSHSTVQVGLLEKGCDQAHPQGETSCLGQRVLDVALIRNESVCFQPNISPTADETGCDCTFQSPGSLRTMLWGLPGPLASSWRPGAHTPGSGVWLPAWMRTLFVAKCWQHPNTSSLPILLNLLDLSSTDANLACGGFTRPQEMSIPGTETACVVAQRCDNGVAALEKVCVLCGWSVSLLPSKGEGERGQVLPACRRPRALRICGLGAIGSHGN